MIRLCFDYLSGELEGNENCYIGGLSRFTGLFSRVTKELVFARAMHMQARPTVLTFWSRLLVLITRITNEQVSLASAAYDWL